MKLIVSTKNVFSGLLIYAIGDTVATLILGNFNLYRLSGIAIVGALLYSIEIPNYFRWIDNKIDQEDAKRWIKRTVLAMMYFNPLWIARHIFFLRLFSGQELSTLAILKSGSLSFLFNIPVSFAGNYIIQNKIALKWRFAASASFSSLLAIYYAMSEKWF